MTYNVYGVWRFQMLTKMGLKRWTFSRASPRDSQTRYLLQTRRRNFAVRWALTDALLDDSKGWSTAAVGQTTQQLSVKRCQDFQLWMSQIIFAVRGPSSGFCSWGMPRGVWAPFKGMRAGIQVLAGIALSSQTVGSNTTVIHEQAKCSSWTTEVNITLVTWQQSCVVWPTAAVDQPLLSANKAAVKAHLTNFAP